MRARHMSIADIAAAIGASTSAVHRWTRDIPSDRRPESNRARRAKPPAWLAEAMALIDAGESRHAVAERLAVPRSTLYRMLARFGALTRDPPSPA